ncbi:MAG TPA: type VI secretion system tip protein TssI/VgrG [Alphaproteobacteria bacterium]|nr:type VI secretion system tip protein TssI/VgrG [Alphaproteobacteria bacterium]
MAQKGGKVFLDVKTSGGPFELNIFKGVERLSDLFEYTLIMTAKSRDVDFDSLMKKPATVSVKVGSLNRTYNGIIGRFEQEGTPFKPLDMSSVYKATLYPTLWLLTFSGQCRIFQNKSTMDIIKDVLDENKITYSNQVTSAGMQKRDFCVQYNETNFNFISRLMEEEGIFYFFQQTQGNHTLVLADSMEGHPYCPDASSVSYHDSGPHEPFMLKVSSCFIKQRIVPQSNTLKSYNYLMPKTPLKAQAKGTSDAGGGEITTYDEIYDQQTYGDELVKVKLQSEETPQKMVEGVSLVPFFIAGYKFTLEKHPRSDANKTYVLYEVIHEARVVPEEKDGPIYKNTYQAFPATIPFRPAQITHKPRIYGTQTAKVTGKEGEEIYTEEYGRIKVKFHWDPSEKEDDTTSCWIRVATLWSGQKWGTLFTPRVGHEVVVSFIDGDPDKPLVIGSVYNGENKPPYLPQEPTKSTIKSQTSKKGDEPIPGYNEFRFEDKKMAEEIYIHAQKDFKIDVQNNQDITIVGGNRTILLKAEEEVQEQREGTQSNDSLKLINGNKSLQIVKGNYSIQLDEGNITVTCAKGNVNFDVNGDISFKCTGNFNVDAAQTVSLKAGATATMEAGADASVKAGAAIEITAGATVAVTGALITLNG